MSCFLLNIESINDSWLMINPLFFEPWLARRQEFLPVGVGLLEGLFEARDWTAAGADSPWVKLRDATTEQFYFFNRQTGDNEVRRAIRQ